MKLLLKYFILFVCLSGYRVFGQTDLSVISFNKQGFQDIPKYERFEVGVKLPIENQLDIDNFLEGKKGINPYDPSQIEIVATYTSQNSNKTFKRNGFYFKDFIVSDHNWISQNSDFTYRVRFAPPETGLYTAQISLRLNQSMISSIEFTFSVSENDNPGHLLLANGNLRKLQHENGKMFFGIGQNIGYVIDAQALQITTPTTCLQWYCRPPGSYDVYRSYIKDIAANNGNFVRVRLTSFDFPIEWPEWKMYSSDPEPTKTLFESINNYDHNQRFMWEFDKVINLCEDYNIYVMLNIMGDGSWSVKKTPGEGEDFGWNRNPYSALLGGDLSNLKRFFSDPTAKNYYKRFLYYVHARWGYSSNIGMWQLINETEQLEGFQQDPIYAEAVNGWICEMKSYLETMYPWHPVTNGSIGTFPQPDCLNIWSKNSYNISITNCEYDNGNFNQRAKNQYDYNNQGRPFIWGELGTDPLTDMNLDKEFHNALWSTTMMGGIATGMYWWDYRQKYGINHRKNFNSLSEFCKKIDWSEVLVAGKDMSEGGINCRSEKEKKKIYSFWQTNKALNFAFGWSVNASSIWYSEPKEYLVQQDFAEVSRQTECIPATNPYDIISSPCHPQMHVKGLMPLTKYDIEIYDTYDVSNKLLENLTEYTDVLGNLKFQRKMPFRIQDPFYPDYAFIVRTNEHNHGRIRVYPNPANDFVNFELMDDNITEFTAHIYNELGQLVLIQKNNRTISVADLASGFYILKVFYGDTNKTAKLIIQH